MRRLMGGDISSSLCQRENGNAGVSAKRSDGDRACCADMTPAAHQACNLLLTRTCSRLLITHGYVTESTDLSR